jgi:hypothetical protein
MMADEMAATPMVPDELGPEQRATRLRLRNERWSSERAIELSLTRQGILDRRADLRRQDKQSRPFRSICEELGHKCSLRVVGYLRGPRPDGVDCERPLRVVCVQCESFRVWACSGHRESKCRPCAARYRRRVRALASEGMKRPGGFHYFGTFTAPSDVHYYGKSGEECPCSVRGFDVAKWNASHSRRWNHLRTLLRRAYPGIEFFRGIEPQDGKRRSDGRGRGALHDHSLFWSPVEISLLELRKFAIRAGFGHEVQCPEIRPGSTQAAFYVSKYVTEACDGRDDVPWWGDGTHARDLVDEETGELVPGLVTARYRTWSQSRGWGTTMAAVRAQAALWAQVYADREEESLLAVLGAQLGSEAVLVPDTPPPMPS